MGYFNILLIIFVFYFLYKKLIIKRESLDIEFDLQPKRGTKSERALVAKLTKHGIPEQTIFHDLYLRKYDGNYTQIDLVVATKIGIIVFEVKDYSGWIFGTGYKPKWLQVLNFGREKNYFYNPILQNAKHIEDLKKELKQFKEIPFYSIIVFYGDCKLKDINFVPNNTFVVKSGRILEVLDKLLLESHLANYTNKREIVDLLESAVKNGEDSEIIIQHSNRIKKMIGKDRVYK
jgi:hypothetical protein